MITAALLLSQILQEQEIQRPASLTDQKALDIMLKVYEVAKQSPYVDEDFPPPPTLANMEWETVQNQYFEVEWVGEYKVFTGNIFFYPDGSYAGLMFNRHFDLKYNLSRDERLEMAKKYYKALGGTFELAIRLEEDRNQQGTLFDFDFLVPGTNHRVAGEYFNIVEPRYGLPSMRGPQIVDPSQFKAVALPVSEIQGILVNEIHKRFEMWQMIVAINPSPIYRKIKGKNEYVLTYETTCYDDLSRNSTGEFQRFVVAYVNAENGKLLMTAPSWMTFGNKPKAQVLSEFSWGQKPWQIGNVSGKILKAIGEPTGHLSPKMILSQGKRSVVFQVDYKQGLIFTKIKDTWLAGKPTGSLKNALMKQ